MTSEPWATVHVGRQAIQGVNGDLYGYELLFRDASAIRFASQAGDGATTSTVLAAFSEFHIGDLLAGRRGFVNLSRRFITGELPLPFGPEAAGLEVLETIERDDEAIAGVRRLSAQGYQIVLDDFVWTAGAQPLVELADIVKIDVLALNWAEVMETIELVRPFGVRLLAEKIENHRMLRRCVDEGFDLFQGYHLGHPETLSARTLGPAQAQALSILGLLSDPDVTPDAVSESVRRDPALTFRLLRIVNSAAAGLSRPVSSVGDALIMVGLVKLRAWLVLMSMTPTNGAVADVIGALVRAGTCERVAARIGPVRPDIAFTLGLLDGLAESLDLRPGALVEQLPLLGPELTQALVGRAGPLRDLLDAVLAYEQADLERLALSEIPLSVLAESYLEALAWTTETSRSVENV
jgi:EAL and modified HD-GYP domain-containing signal transduction protein